MTLVTANAYLPEVQCDSGSYDEIEELLSIVGGIIELRAIHAKSRQVTGRHFEENREGCVDIREILAFIHKHAGDDIYFAPAARKDSTSGGLKNCTALRCLFCDSDYKDFLSAEIGRQKLDAFPLKPSYIVETGATVKINHHDVKPSTDNRDDHRRSHKASGGDWFAAAECPISYQLAGDNRAIVIPEDYKFSRDPQPFVFRLETDDPRTPTTARLIGETSIAEDSKTVALRQKILEYLGGHSAGASGRAIIQACRIRREDGFAVLGRLSKDGLVDRIRPGGKGRKQTWILTNKEDEQNAN